MLRRSALVSLNPPLFSEDPVLTMPTQDLALLAQQLRDQGVETTLHPITCAYTPYGNCEYWNGAPMGQPGWWDSWFSAYSRLILTQVDAANRVGASAIIIGDYRLRPSLPGEPEAAVNADAQWRLLIMQVRARFRGRIGFALLLGQNLWPNPPAFLDSVDFIRLETWAPLGASGAASVSDVAFAAASLLDGQVAPLAARFGKPIILGAAYPSVDGGVTQCVRQPDGACAPVSAFEPDTPRNGFALDLAEQADVYNGLLVAVAGRPYIAGFSAPATTRWPRCATSRYRCAASRPRRSWLRGINVCANERRARERGSGGRRQGRGGGERGSGGAAAGSAAAFAPRSLRSTLRRSLRSPLLRSPLLALYAPCAPCAPCAPRSLRSPLLALPRSPLHS